MIVEWIIGSLLLAWLLSLFNFNGLFIEATSELLSITLSNASYYFIFFLFGTILGTIEFLKKR